MNPFNPHHARVAAARCGRYLKGSRRKIAWVMMLAVVALASGLGIAASAGWFWLILSPALLLLLLLIWDSLYLQELPPAGNITDQNLQLELVASAELLRVLKKDQTAGELWQALSKDWQWRFITYRLLLDPIEIGQLLQSSAGDFWQLAQELSLQNQQPQIETGALSTALILNLPNAENYLAQHKLTLEDVLGALSWQVRAAGVIKKLQQKRSFGGVARDWASGYTPLLNQFGNNLSTDVEAGAYQHLYLQTHAPVLDQMQTALSQSQGGAVALVGGTGSGKTSLGYALAERLLDSRTKGPLRYYKLVALNASLIVSEAKRMGNLEALLLHIVAEARAAGDIILFFDDAQSFFTDDAGAMNIGNVLLQVLRSNAVRMVLALRPADWQSLSASASDITARIQQLMVPEPDQAVVERVAQDQCLAIEAETHTTVGLLAVREAYQLAERYQPDQAFPGKAITLLRTSANYAQGGWILAEAVQAAIEASLGVKVGTATAGESAELLNLEENLHSRMINQVFAVKVVADALRRARAGVRNLNRPVGTFLFLGPTGVGKTELTKSVAAIYFGGEQRLVRLDMSEYNQADSVQRLLAPAANPGTFLTHVRQEPFTVVLLDEIEKASSEVLNLLLQMLDEGQLTDTSGRTISFRDAIIVATSNAGADIIRKHIEQGENLENFSAAFTDQLIDSQQFRPELINRFDEVVLFRPLNQQELAQVVQLLLAEINRTLEKQRISVGLSEAAVARIVETGFDPRLGARPMRRMMQRTVENVVAKRVLSGKLQPGSQIMLDVAELEL